MQAPPQGGNQLLETLQNYEDWLAESLVIILNIPNIQAKERHTEGELKSLTLEPWVLLVHLPGQELTQMG